MILSPATAAARAWLAVLRRGFGTRGLADALVEAFDCAGLETVRNDWQALIDVYGDTDGYQALCAAVVERFDLLPKAGRRKRHNCSEQLT